MAEIGLLLTKAFPFSAHSYVTFPGRPRHYEQPFDWVLAKGMQAKVMYAMPKTGPSNVPYTPSLCPQIFQPDAENSVKVTEAPGDSRITNWKVTEPLGDSGTNYSFAIISNIQQTELWEINLL